MSINIIHRKIHLLKEVFTPTSYDERHFEMDWTMEGGGIVPPHFHRHTDEHFTVTKGTVTFWVNGELLVKQVGDTLSVPRMTPHSIANKTNTQVGLRVRYTPCADTHKMFIAWAYFSDKGNGTMTGMMKWWYVQEKLNWLKFSEPANAGGRVIFGVIGEMAMMFGAIFGWEEYLKDFENV